MSLSAQACADAHVSAVAVTLAHTRARDVLASYVRLSLRHADRTQGDRRVLPAWYSQNMVTLLPGETVDVRIEYAGGPANRSRGLEVGVTGWNVRPLMVKVQSGCSSSAA